MINYLTEAFKELSVLKEDTFDLDSDGIKELKDFEDNDDIDTTVDIIDAKADDEEELSDSYVGKVILDCCVCHSKIYEDKEDIHIDEEEGLANVGEECPFCYAVDGFKIIGQVTEFNPEAKEEIKAEIKSDDDDEKDDDEKDDDEIEKNDEEIKVKVTNEAVSKRDDIDAEADDRKERARKILAKMLDRADADRDYRRKKGITRKDESLEQISIDTGEQIIDVEAHDKDDCEECKKDEVIEPVNIEAKNEIEAHSDNEDEEDVIDVDFDDVDEKEFDIMGESYLKRAYNNVNGFKTVCVKTNKNHMMIEGVITFASGNKKKTSFMFESKDCDKNGKVRFIGENKEICKGRKAYTLVGNVKDKKLIPESFNYNYKVKDTENGMSKRIYGTVRAKH